MKAADIRQSFLDFFARKEHTIVSSASLLPTAPNLLFTNAGMNQFVPIFLGEEAPRVSQWPGVRQGRDTRAADTQKCIRAGGKHNDLDDVGYDAYHQTFFEMLGNWSFGDYFKEEAINWSWELLTQVWKLPAERLYATVYRPDAGDPADEDAEAAAIWTKIFEAEGLDPQKHLIYSGKKDNFWMMGDTGPCGPCSEVHMDLTPQNRGDLVNADSPWCIELWNNVFIQFNAKVDGSFEPLKQKHVDTGMGFERVAGIFATTDNLTRFDQPPSNYNADLFTPIFDRITELCGQAYGKTLPADPKHPTEAEMRDIIFRVLADHIRCLCCAIADGIMPGNTDRNYVLRRILRRAVMYGRRLELKAGFFSQLIDPVLATLGDTFPELRTQEKIIRKVIASEEAAFDRTLDRGMAEFEKVASADGKITGANAFKLYDTYGFPLDLTQLLAEERGLGVDVQGFEAEMEKQRGLGRAAQKKSVIEVSEGAEASAVEATTFVGYEPLNWRNFTTRALEVVQGEDKRSFLITKESPFYAELGGQLGDAGQVKVGDAFYPITDTQKDASGRYLHALKGDVAPAISGPVELSVDLPRRLQIQRHHTATHILHWALREVLGMHVKQAGSYVGPDRLRFDFAHFEAISAADLRRIEALCNEKVLSNDPVTWYEIPYRDKPEDIVAFFGEKYGDKVRVVEIGGQVRVEPEGLSYRLVNRAQGGWSAELCGGTHVQATGEIGLIKIVAESAISAGTRRIEAVAGEAAAELVQTRFGLVDELARQFAVKPEGVPARVADLKEKLSQAERELKQLKAAAAAQQAASLTDQAVTVGDVQVLTAVLAADHPNALRDQASKILDELENGLVVVGGVFGPKVTVVAMASEGAMGAGFKAGDIIRELTGKLGGKGGGKPDFAMGGGSEVDALPRVLQDWQAGLGA